MKVFDPDRFESTFGGEYTLGTKDLHSLACCMVYGILRGRELDRLVQPGQGYEEIFGAFDDPVLMRTKLG